MEKRFHTVYLLFLVAVGLLSAVVIGIHGAAYYRTPVEERPFHPQYEALKPTGLLGQGFGVIGTGMISFGVVLYSSRKRLRALANVGRINYFLEFHIFLCLLGPILVLYHTTFKFGGIVSVSFWSMTAVVASGMLGRYFYVQIPKGIRGNELSFSEMQSENAKLAELLQTRHHLPPDILRSIDALAAPPKEAAAMSLTEIINFFLVNDVTRRSRLRHVFAQLERRGIQPASLRRLRVLASRRVTLTRRIAFLQQFRQIFHYWHVVHLPFSIVMFLILFVHVGVAVAFGYTWIW